MTPAQNVETTTGQLNTEAITPASQFSSDSGIGPSFISPVSQSQEDDSDGWEDCSDDEDDDYIPMWDEEVSDTESVAEHDYQAQGDVDLHDETEESMLSITEETPMTLHDAAQDTVPGFSLVYDNTQWETTARHQGKNKNKMTIVTNALAVEHRVPAAKCEDRTVDAHDIPVDTYVQQEPDDETLAEYALSEIDKAIVGNVPHFKGYKDVAVWHVPHQHSREMAEKSKVVSPYFYIFTPCVSVCVTTRPAERTDIRT